MGSERKEFKVDISFSTSLKFWLAFLVMLIIAMIIAFIIMLAFFTIIIQLFKGLIPSALTAVALFLNTL